MVTSNLGSTGGQAQGQRVVTPRTVTTPRGWLEGVKTCCPRWDPTAQSPCTVFFHAEGMALPLHADGVGAQGRLRGQREGQIHDSLPRGHIPPLRDAIPAGILRRDTRDQRPGSPANSPWLCPVSPLPALPSPPHPGCPKLTFRNTRGSWKAKRGWSEEQFHPLGSHRSGVEGGFSVGCCELPSPQDALGWILSLAVAGMSRGQCQHGTERWHLPAP